MEGFIYVVSNHATPGLYKILCSSLDLVKETNKIYIPGYPVSFDVEYILYIDRYEEIADLAHYHLSKDKYDEEFYNGDILICILEIKRIIVQRGNYKEKYMNDILKLRVEACENFYLAKRKAESELLLAQGTIRAIEEEDRKKIMELRIQRAIAGIIISYLIGLLFYIRDGSSWPWLVTGIGVIMSGFFLIRSIDT